MIPDIVIFGRTIPWYGLCFYFGIALAAIATMLLCRRIRFPRWEIVYSAIFMMIGAILGAKLLFILVSWEDIVAYDLSLVEIIKGGFVFFGGLIGGLSGIWIYTRLYKYPIAPYLDIYAVVLPLGHAFGRVGCFLAGCCYGVPCSFGLAYRFSANLSTPLNTPLLPIQLIEAGCLLLIFVIQLCLFRRRRFIGQTAVSYCLMYAILRFTLEYFRGDAERGILLGLSTSQWISVLMAIAATVALIFLYRSHTRKSHGASSGTPADAA